MTEKKDKSGFISRREFLKDAGLLIGGTAVGSAVLLSACGGETETVTSTVTKTATTTAPGGTTTVTTTAQGGTVTSTVTQNKYVCPYDGLEFDTLEELKAHCEAEHGGQGVPEANVINLTVNGEAYQVEVEPQETLHEVVRNKIGFLSLKEMCTGYGACGSCSLIMDGRPVLSCMVLAAECDGKVLETAEGIAQSRPDLVEAYIVNHCMQCGYCTPGFIVTAKALLDHNPNPSDEEIKEALGGNICRCATYPQHVLAVKDVI